MNILGISCYYHDSAAALIRDSKIIAASQEERFTRKKHDEGFPHNAIKYCLKEGNLTGEDLDYVVFYDKPFIKFERLLQTYFATWPRSLKSYLKAIPVWIQEKLWIANLIRDELNYEGELLFSNHHLSHAASAFYVSPYKEAAILTIDGVGEWATSTEGIGKDLDIEIRRELRFPHSLGLLYSAFTYYLGFKVNSAEYKVMGLAPYGEPKYVDKIMNELIDVKEDGSIKMNMRYFAYDYGLKMTNENFDKLFGQPPRIPETELTQFHKDMAASLQRVTEEIMLKMAINLRKETGMRYLCLAGGVALNCVANGEILRRAGYDDIFIQPAAGDAGGALGAALVVNCGTLRLPRPEPLTDVFLGPEFSKEEILKTLKKFKAVYREYEYDELIKEVAERIEKQHVVGWLTGRMEFGPRSLGTRSILADARNKENWQKVNLKIKFRESFRPFAPTVLEERVNEYFELDRPSPYMLLVADVRKEIREDKQRAVPSITHVNNSARIQTINRKQNPIYYDLLKEFEKRTKCPVIINTSFNVRGEPIVCTPEDAYRCFMRTHMDTLVLGPFILNKENQPSWHEEVDWRIIYVPD
ncbi:MAG: carbamoyltransferase [Candidatus Hydrogenedentota bacterium]